MSNQAGKWITTLTGYKAFIPNPLPPSINWSLELVQELSNADRLVGELSGEGRRLPNPHLLIHPFLAKEAVLSSRIEGTQTTLSELLAVNAGITTARDMADVQEVSNYVAALEYGIKRLNTLPVSLRLLCELHEKLMQGVRGHHATPGEFRKTQNWIGHPGSTLNSALYVPPPADYLISCLRDLEKFLHDKSLPPLIQIALAHYQFEAIHPYLDGNGRIGRLLIILFLIERNVLSSPILYLSAFFEATRQDYYDNLSAITKNNAWEQWLVYFLRGIGQQAKDSLAKTKQINNLVDKWRMKTTNLSSTLPSLLIEKLGNNPFITKKSFPR